VRVAWGAARSNGCVRGCWRVARRAICSTCGLPSSARRAFGVGSRVLEVASEALSLAPGALSSACRAWGSGFGAWSSACRAFCSDGGAFCLGGEAFWLGAAKFPRGRIGQPKDRSILGSERTRNCGAAALAQPSRTRRYAQGTEFAEVIARKAGLENRYPCISVTPSCRKKSRSAVV
jgi:hypothetical protein